MSSRFVLTVCALLAAYIAPVHAQDDDAAQRRQRWVELQQALFPARTITENSEVIQLEAPARAMDAALVPLTVTLSEPAKIRSVYIVIDNNPGPLAGRFTFGPAADARTLKVRMRVNTYTNIHAVAEDAQGRLYSVEKFVKASGGCSAPAGSNDEESMRQLGRMKVKLLNEFAPGQSLHAQLMIRHPNFNGMQMDQLTRMYTPAHFIKTIDVSYRGEQVLHVESDIALSTDPVLTFGVLPREPGQLRIEVKDSKDQSYVSEFPVPQQQMSAETR